MLVRSPLFPVVLAVASALAVGAMAGGLGVLFIALARAGLGNWGAIVIGLALVAVVPAVALTVIRRHNWYAEEGRP